MLDLVPLALSSLALAAYLLGWTRLRRRGDAWPRRRVWCLVGGHACIAVAALQQLGPAGTSAAFPGHVIQHLLVGMVAPALLVLSAPVTLALRVVSPRVRRPLLQVLRSRLVTVATSSPAALALSLGGLYGLYLTGLYAATERNELLHAAVHLHVFLAGCLLSWVVVGVDPVRRRTVGATLTTLVLAGAGHDVLAKLLYARGLPAGGGTLADRQLGAQLMYYGGTVVDLALAVVVMAQWWRITGRQLERAARRAETRALP